MSYQKQNILPVLSSEEGFNKAAKTYRQYRDHLATVDHNQYKRFLPRDLTNKVILDLGAGDGRIYDHFKPIPYKAYLALDISPKMLDRFQSSAVQKIVADAEEDFPLDDSSVDVVCMFFFLEYIEDLQHLFLEIARVLVTGGVAVATYSHQKNGFVFGHGDESYKIERFIHTYDQIRESAEYAFLTIDELPIVDEGKIVGYIYEFKKD